MTSIEYRDSDRSIPWGSVPARREKKRQATLANRLPGLDLSRFFEKGLSEARKYMTRYGLLQVFLQRPGVSEGITKLARK